MVWYDGVVYKKFLFFNWSYVLLKLYEKQKFGFSLSLSHNDKII